MKDLYSVQAPQGFQVLRVLRQLCEQDSCILSHVSSFIASDCNEVRNYLLEI